MVKKPELLAPAGNVQALKAAVLAGADAVYIGGKSFSARKSADNFTDEEIINSLDYCHLYDKKLYVAINILIKDSEINDVISYVKYLYESGVDALIIQDLGLYRIIKEIFPNMPLHSSTQMSIHSIEGVLLLEEMGFSRIVLARELNINEIQDIVGKSKSEIKIFNHGAMCISYSGQCLMSSMIGGRSGNRGNCAQPCRKKYQILKNERSIDEGYIISPKDLNTLGIINQIKQSGAHSIKIEGRMKSPEYVYTIVDAYRKAIDNIENKNMLEIEQVFNRGFSTGYLLGYPGGKLINKNNPKNRGVYLGEIYNVQNNKGFIKLNQELVIGDGIEIRNKTSNFGQEINRIYNIKMKNIESANKGEVVVLEFKERVQKGSKVHKTYDMKLSQKHKGLLSKEFPYKLPLDAFIIIQKDKPVKIKVISNNYTKTVIGNIPVEEAENISITKQRISEQVSKLGNTPFYLRNIDINIEEEKLRVPIAQINKVRREATQLLQKEITEKYRRKDPTISITNLKHKSIKESNTMLLSIKTSSLDIVDIIKDTNVDEIIFGGDILYEEEKYNKAVEKCKKANKRILLAFPRITRNNYLFNLKEEINNILSLDADGILISNYGLLNIFKDYDIYKEIDSYLNIFNSFALSQLKDMNINLAYISPELNYKEIKSLISESPLPLGYVVNGNTELMVMEYCIWDKCNKKDNCINCEKANIYLKDTKGFEFPIKIDEMGKSHIYNSRKLCLLEELSKLKGMNKIRIDVTNENNEEILKSIHCYKEYMNQIIKGNNELTEDCRTYLKRNKTHTTKGHFNRGV